MKVVIAPGKYVLAVSGGVDSMALLHLLANKPGLELIVAHFNHGIRSDSGKDERLVRKTAKTYGVAYETGEGKLGPNTSEDTARQARYEFLASVREKSGARAIVTAHHQDDKIETALLNILRGTGRRGLSAITNNKMILRPLLDTSKRQIITYATDNGLDWREDPTNANPDFLRNYLRLKVLPRITQVQKQELISYIDKVAKTNLKIDNLIAIMSQSVGNNKIDRNLFSALPVQLGNELVVYHLRQASVSDFDSKTVERLSMAIKTAKPVSYHNVKQNSYLRVGVNTASFLTP